MQEIMDFIGENKVGALATVEGGQARVRPFQLMFAEKGRFWFCTANTKPVFAQLKAKPEVEFLASQGSAWLRLRGKAVFSSDRAMKERILEENPMIKSIYGSADNPVFEVFALEGIEAELRDLSGRTPKKVRF
jgi:uncharacterized pyridoxamine 5'-phosphate oxidase family protein